MGRKTQSLINLHMAWEGLVFDRRTHMHSKGRIHVKKQIALPQDSQPDITNSSSRDTQMNFSLSNMRISNVTPAHIMILNLSLLRKK